MAKSKTSAENLQVLGTTVENLFAWPRGARDLYNPECNILVKGNNNNRQYQRYGMSLNWL